MGLNIMKNGVKIINLDDIDGLFEVIKSCIGSVHLVSQDGDDILLTSKLSRIFLEALKNDGSELINELELRCDNPEDTIKFIEFMARG